MTTLAKLYTTHTEVNYSTLANKYYHSSSETAYTNEQVALTLTARIIAFFDAWTQNSYDSWEKSGRTEEL
jgi:hypothetical protein